MQGRDVASTGKEGEEKGKDVGGQREGECRRGGGREGSGWERRGAKGVVWERGEGGEESGVGRGGDTWLKEGRGKHWRESCDVLRGG